MKTMTSVEAQNRFGQLLDTAQHEPVAITRHGRAAAFVVSQREMDELLEAQQRRRDVAVKEFKAWRAEARKHRTAAAAKLTDEDVVRLVHELR